VGLLDVTIVNVAVPIARRGCFSDLPQLNQHPRFISQVRGVTRLRSLGP
jgi:hypothetical protein